MISVQTKKLIIRWIFVAIALGVVIFGVWYFIPKTFLKGVEPEEVAKISVFNGSSGDRMEIVDPEEIKYIVNNIQNTKMKRDKLCVGYMGFSFSMRFLDKDGNIIDDFTINSSDTIRGRKFFYTCEDDSLCYDYLSELEDKYGTLYSK